MEKEIPGALVYQIPLIRDVLGHNTKFLSRTHIGFIGGYRHLPNIDAVRYFLDSIWPLVKMELPDVQFYLIGADMPRRIEPEDGCGFGGLR